jgi:outer membrane protein TolC
MARFGWWLIPAVVIAAPQTDLPAQLTLRQALDLALTNSTIIGTALSELNQASGRTEQFRSPLLPQVNIGARQGYQTLNLKGFGIDLPGSAGSNMSNQLIGPYGSMDARVFLNWQILNLSAWKGWRSSQSKEQSYSLLVDNARELVALRVIATYLEALRAKAGRDTLIEQTKLASDLYRITLDRVKQGASAQLDANRALQVVNTREQERLEAEQAYVAEKLALANLLQARITPDFDVTDEAAYGTGTPPERDATVKVALDSRADYRSATATVNAAELRVRAIKDTRLPTIEMVFTDGQSGSTPAHNVNTYRIQGNINFPVFTGGRIQGEVAEAEAALREAKTALDQDRFQIETDVLTAISGVDWALKQVDVSAGNVTLSRQEVDFTRQRFTSGVADNTEVVNAQDRLARANDAEIRARYNLGLARANLARSTGAAEKTYRK